MGENISKYRNLHQRNVSRPVFFNRELNCMVCVEFHQLDSLIKQAELRTQKIELREDYLSTQNNPKSK